MLLRCCCTNNITTDVFSFSLPLLFFILSKNETQNNNAYIIYEARYCHITVFKLTTLVGVYSTRHSKCKGNQLTFAINILQYLRNDNCTMGQTLTRYTNIIYGRLYFFRVLMFISFYITNA